MPLVLTGTCRGDQNVRRNTMGAQGCRVVQGRLTCSFLGTSRCESRPALDTESRRAVALASCTILSASSLSHKTGQSRQAVCGWGEYATEKQIQVFPAASKRRREGATFGFKSRFWLWTAGHERDRPGPAPSAHGCVCVRACGSRSRSQSP